MIARLPMAFVLLTLGSAVVVDAAEQGDSAGTFPIRVFQPTQSINFLSFENNLLPGNRIGYRLHEHAPLTAGGAPRDATEAGIDSADAAALEDLFQGRTGVFRHVRTVTEEGWVPQKWTFHLAPAEDGVEILWVIETTETGLPKFYSAQQCFRLGGITNQAWRRRIAEAPAFSEYDLWTRQAREGRQPTSLSFVLRGGRWEEVPPISKRLVSATPLGVELALLGKSSAEILEVLDPLHEGALDREVDAGLVARAASEAKWICALYWDRATHVSHHHPADCLHVIVNLGPIPPHGKRAIRGRIYWLRGGLDDLYQKWRREFAVKESLY